MEELSLQEIHDETLNVLIRFDKLCKSIGVKYYLAYGTLLGAIRHGGFIPWDDDADVWMKRDDYNKLVEFCNKNVNELKPYKLCSRENTLNFYYGFLRFANNNFKYVPTTIEKPMDIGVFIDIYPLDNFGNSQKQAQKVQQHCKMLNHFYSAYINPKGSSLFLKIVRPIVYIVMRVIHGNDYNLKANSDIEEYIGRHTSKDDRYVGIPAWTLLSKAVVYEKRWFKDSVDINFEGTPLPCPCGWDELLKRIYGDYMLLPPEKDRQPYHSYKIFSKNN